MKTTAHRKEQESPPVWPQEAYRLQRSLSFRGGGVPLLSCLGEGYPLSCLGSTPPPPHQTGPEKGTYAAVTMNLKNKLKTDLHPPVGLPSDWRKCFGTYTKLRNWHWHSTKSNLYEISLVNIWFCFFNISFEFKNIKSKTLNNTDSVQNVFKTNALF